MLSSADVVLLLAAVIVIVPSFKIFVLGPDKDISMPPGPARLGKGPFDMPAEPYKRFLELAKEYGT